MTRQQQSQGPILSAEAIDAYSRKARALRSQAFLNVISRAAKAFTAWKADGAAGHRFETMPEYLLADVGVSRTPLIDALAGASNDNLAAVTGRRAA